jgi:hypothetical protein
MKKPGDRGTGATSFPPWWDAAAQRQVFDLIRGLIEILVPFTSTAILAGAFFRCVALDHFVRQAPATRPSSSAGPRSQFI